MFTDVIKTYDNIITKLTEKHPNTPIPTSKSGVYLLLCGYINDAYSIFKPGISNTNLYKATKNSSFIADFISLIQQTFNVNYVKMSNEITTSLVYKQLQSRNGSISKTNQKMFSSYESKENYLPVLNRYSLPILQAIFIENYLTFVLHSSFLPPQDLNFHHGRLFYNGYCYKAYVQRRSTNETESKILHNSFHHWFNDLLTAFHAEPVQINTKQNQAKFKCLTDYYNQFKFLKNEHNPSLTYNDYLIQFRTNDVFKYKHTSVQLRYKKEADIEPTILSNLKLTIATWKNNKLKLSDIDFKLYLSHIILALELHLIEYENSKIKYL